MDPQSVQTVVAPSTMPVRRRSKMACDTCHYRKIKCNVEKSFPCKNCEKNAVQCTMVGPSMRPPRSISGSSSVAAAAAVAMAMATAANARLTSANFVHSFEGLQDPNRTSSPRPTYVDERARFASRTEESHHQLNLFNPLMRRSSASSVQALDEGSESSDVPRQRRKLQSFSSSPSSLRNLFNSGGGGGPLRSTASSLSASIRHPETPPAINRHPSTNTYGGREPLSAEAKAPGSYDYFNLPLSHSAGSTPSVSSPSCNILARGMAQLNPFDDSRLPSTASALSSSLPPTPTHPVFDRSSEGIVSPTSPFDPALAPFRPQSLQGTHRLVGHVLKQMPRRTSSSPYLISQYQNMDSQTYHLPDRRSSLPWDAHIASPSPQPYEARPLATSQQRIEMIAQAPSPATLNNSTPIKDRDQDIVTPPPQGYLMRSNSTPAIFGSPQRFIGYAIQDRQGSENQSALQSRQPETDVDPARIGANTSVYKIVQDIPLPPQTEFRPYRPGHPFDVHEDSNEHSLPQLPQSQGNWSNQYNQQNDLPRGMPSDSDQPSEATLRQFADMARGTHGGYNGSNEYSENLQGSPFSRQLKNTVYDSNMILNQDIPNQFFVDTSRQQDFERPRASIKDQGPNSGWTHSSFNNVDRSWVSKDQPCQTTLQEEHAQQVQVPPSVSTTSICVSNLTTDEVSMPSTKSYMS
ncbi:hypothetical protein BGZ65_007644, partial [Modicella reniformis]